MAGRLIGAWNPALDSAGVSISGAKLYTYIAGTTTPKTTYTTVALSTPQANPVVADSAGRFPELWAADGATFDLKWTDAAGVQITLFQSVQSLGSTATGAVTRDFGADGRLNLESRGGITYLEGGDPSPDNIGGKVRVGGWAGTQADTIILDGAAVSATGPISPGAGVKFPATQVSSSDPNTLDDYEEGTWTPRLTGDTGASGQTYTVQVGRYIKVGRKITCWGSITLSVVGTMSGTFAVIAGLPYLPDTSVSPSLKAVGGFMASAGITNHYSAATYFDHTSNFVYIALKTGSGTSFASAVIADVSAGAKIDFTFDYLAAF